MFLLLFFCLFCYHTQFASLLASAEGGGVSTNQLEEAKLGLHVLLDGLKERRKFEEFADERREEEERKERIIQEESDRRKRLREEERARRPGSRGASRGNGGGGGGGGGRGGGGRGSSSSMNTKSLGSKHADFVEMKVHGLEARISKIELTEGKLRILILGFGVWVLACWMSKQHRALKFFSYFFFLRKIYRSN